MITCHSKSETGKKATCMNWPQVNTTAHVQQSLQFDIAQHACGHMCVHVCWDQPAPKL